MARKYCKPKLVKTDKECEKGCGNTAKYISPGGIYLCEASANKCPSQRQKNSLGLKNKHKNNPVGWNRIKKGSMIGWDNLTKEQYQLRLQKGVETRRRLIKEGKILPSFKGKKHTKESKEKISKGAKGFTNGYAKCKWFKIWCPTLKKDVNVQGALEYEYARYLNIQNVSWIKSRKNALTYTKSEEDYNHTYYPDFYLPASNEYIELKGFWFKSKDGKSDDKFKMKCVLECNLDKQINILMTKDIEMLTGRKYTEAYKELKE